MVCPHPLHTQDGVLELITLVRTAQVHAHVVDEKDLLASLGSGMLPDGVSEDQVRQATVVHKVEHHLQIDVALCGAQAPIVLEQMRRAVTAQESKTRRQQDEGKITNLV